MHRFGFALALANIFLQSAGTGDSSVPSEIPPSSNDSLRFVKTGEFRFSSSANGSVRAARKCCPRGSSFDANALICRVSRGNLAPANPRFHPSSVGLPDCVDSVLYTFSIRHVEEIELAGEEESIREDYCVDGNDDGTVLVACGNPSDVCGRRPCIRKCKPLGEFYVNDEKLPETTEVSGLSPVFYDLTNLLPDESVAVSSFGLFFGLHCEEGKIRLDVGSRDVNYIGTNGSLYAPGLRKFQVFDQREYCIDYVQGEGTFAFMCLEPEKPIEAFQQTFSFSVLIGLGLAASCVCLLLTFFVYLFSRKSKSLYGKSLMFYVGCLCIAYFSLALVQLGNPLLNERTCIALGYSILLSFLAAFFWLNIMSIDIWKRFRSLRSTEWRKTTNSRSRIVAYSIYGWGTPLFITLLCGTLDALPQSEVTSGINMMRPKIGVYRCWFSAKTHGIYLFFFAPVSLIIACNIVLYMNTAWRCWKVKAEITRLGLQSGRRGGKYSIHREQFLLNGKLFIVMGISWGPEFISEIFPLPLWKITDVLNSLLGVFIFIIFVAKKKVINNATKKLRDSIRSLSKREHQRNHIKNKLGDCYGGMNAIAHTTSI